MTQKRNACSIYLPVSPRVKQRPRLGRGGHVYTPKPTLEYEAALAAEWSQLGLPQFTERIRMSVTYDKNGQFIRISEVDDAPEKLGLRGDLDNYLKATLDGLNGVAYVDDRQIIELHSLKWNPDLTSVNSQQTLEGTK